MVEVDWSHTRYVERVCTVQQQQQDQHIPQPFLQKGEKILKCNRNMETTLEMSNYMASVHPRRWKGYVGNTTFRKALLNCVL